ncbi:MAG TPA: glycoside hydrolase family 9 protein [Chitinispirillaceae bacterium]|nr:glycoside hydrolase family 9 protein [Chitinispirillaceae bacterium]
MIKKFLIFLTLTITTQSFAYDYTNLHKMLIRFYGYQRAGIKGGDAHNLNPNWSKALHQNDAYKGNPLDGGWYDAGDHIKFGMNLSYAVYCLLKGYDVFPSGYTDTYALDKDASDNIPDILNEVKVATDYLMKAVIDANTVILDVGKAEEEHGPLTEIRNPDGRTSDNQFVLASGADVPALYAADLALMSTLYRKIDSNYADKCLAKAKEAFKFAKKKMAENKPICDAQSKGQKDGRPAYLYYYEYNTEKKKYMTSVDDKLVAAGIELYRASDASDPDYATYKSWATRNITNLFTCIGYSFVGPLASIEVWRQGLGTATSLVSNISEHVNARIQESGFFKNIYQNSGWGTARDAGSAAFEYALAYIITSDESKRTSYQKHIENHINWVSGIGGTQSYVVGFQGNSPQKIHYRSPAKDQGGPKGAVVSGPVPSGTSANWQDNGSADYCEVAIDYNAGIIGAIAFLNALANPGSDTKISSAFTVDNKNPSFNTDGVKFSVGFSKSVAWTINIKGAFGSKTLTGTGTSVSQAWDGSADKGVFISGEDVVAKLSIDGNIASYDLLKATPVALSILQAKAPAKSPSDSLVDDFADSDLNNRFGKWVPFGSVTSGWQATTAAVVTSPNTKPLRVDCFVADNEPTTFGGVKATFNAAGSAVTINPAKTIVFDAWAKSKVNLVVELEQTNITDGAYYQTTVPLTEKLNIYRLSISEFVQPQWKTGEVSRDLSKISSVRFTIYDSTNMFYYYLDNVYIEDLQIKTTSILSQSANSSVHSLNPSISNGLIRYNINQNLTSPIEIAIYNVAGKIVLKDKLNATGSRSILLSRLPAGMYTLVHSINGKSVGQKVKFAHIQ